VAVIINDFEVVVEPPSSAGGETPAGQQETEEQSSEPLSPFSLEMIMRQRLLRSTRVNAD